MHDNATETEKSGFRRELLAWFDERSRDLPWRHTRDPYKIWVSEIMLQQTRVETVLSYYQRWMAAYPTLRDLAAAPLEDVLHLWQGLGYYRRARTLHKAARELVATQNGALPQRYEDWLTVPGVGNYTAGAISSIAFDEPVPAVDGNVLRVLSRLYDDERDIGSAKTRRAFEARAATLVDPKRAGDFNQAMMELGATVCTPRRANCLLCPLREVCAVAGTARALELPVKAKKQKQRHEEGSALVLQHNAQTLIVQRHEDGLLGGLWEFPLFSELPPEQLSSTELCGEFVHIFSHIRLQVRVHRGTLSSRSNAPNFDSGLYARAAWVTLEELRDFALSTLMRKMIATLGSALPED